MGWFLISWDINLSGKLCFAKQSSDWFSDYLQRVRVFLTSDLGLFRVHSAGKKILPPPLYFFNLHFGSHMWLGTLLFLISIDFLCWRVLSLTALIITYIQMIFKFTLHFQPFQMMSPFASPQIWLASSFGWATIFFNWIWMRWRLCSLVVNKV